MSVRVRDLFMGELDSLRHEPIDKRIRAQLGGRTVIDSTSAMLVWEPKRVVPSYAVPVDDLHAELSAEPAASERPGAGATDGSQLAGRRVLDPRIPFSVHTSDGEPLTVRSDGEERKAAAFRPADADLAGYVVLDFQAFDAWFEEDERNFAHPRDPFHRIDIVHSSRHVRVESGGELLAESSEPYLLFEPPLPVRYYLPRADVRTELLRPSDTKTWCAYKGRASYWSFAGEDDLVWSYLEPLRDATEVAGRMAFFNERVDIVVDGKAIERPVTPWSRTNAE
jgi:uncharacterized protein (DUF427 family)